MFKILIAILLGCSLSGCATNKDIEGYKGGRNKGGLMRKGKK